MNCRHLKVWAQCQLYNDYMPAVHLSALTASPRVTKLCMFDACLDKIKLNSLFHFSIRISYNGERLLLLWGKTSLGLLATKNVHLDNIFK